MTRIEFGILGPLEVRGSNGPLPLKGAKRRAVLAYLLLHANEVVPAERLVDELWGDGGTAVSANALQAQVSHLRKLLGAGVLETHPPGYRLSVEPGALDRDRFAELFERGRAALAAGDPLGAAAALRAALELWRGPALADLAHEQAFVDEALGLEELRVAALEERIEADLGVGRHADLVPELERLVSANPLRERLRRQLMLALYRAGRQADALEAYRDARRALVDELGLEPSPELQQLERAILRQD